MVPANPRLMVCANPGPELPAAKCSPVGTLHNAISRLPGLPPATHFSALPRSFHENKVVVGGQRCRPVWHVCLLPYLWRSSAC